MSPQQINTRRKERRKTYKSAFKEGEMVKKKEKKKTQKALFEGLAYLSPTQWSFLDTT